MLYKYFTVLKLALEVIAIMFLFDFEQELSKSITKNSHFNLALMSFIILDCFFVFLNLFKFSSNHHYVIRSIFYAYLVISLWLLFTGEPFHSVLDSHIGLFALGSNTFLIPLMIGVPLDISIIEITFLHVLNEIAVIFLMTDMQTTTKTVRDFSISYSSALGLLSISTSYFFLLHRRQGFLNIFNLKLQEKNREKEKARLHEEIIHQKGKYIAQVAHDLGTPLQSFSLAIELLQGFQLTAEMENILASAECAVELMTVTRTEALNHAKHMEGLDVLPCFRQVDLRHILSKCALIMNGFSGAAELPLSFYIDPFVPDRVFTDYEWIWIMITNLLSNAKKYSARGEIQTTVQILKGSGCFRVEVLDDGIGVPDNRKGLLFKPFGQIMKAAGGTGLGLHGVLLKAKKLGGRVGIRDNPMSTSGSVFWFEVPFKQALPNCIETPDSGMKDILSKKNGVPFRRVLFIGVDRDDTNLGDSFSYLQERSVHLTFLSNHNLFVKQPIIVSVDSTTCRDIGEDSEGPEVSCKVKPHKSSTVTENVANLTKKLYQKHNSERDSAQMNSEMQASPTLSAKGNSGGRKSFFAPKTRNITTIEVASRSPSHRSTKNIPEPVQISLEPRASVTSMGYDAVFWFMTIDEMAVLDFDEKCSIVEMVKCKAKQNLKVDDNPYICAVISQSSSSPKEEDPVSSEIKNPLQKQPSQFSATAKDVLHSLQSIQTKKARFFRKKVNSGPLDLSPVPEISGQSVLRSPEQSRSRSIISYLSANGNLPGRRFTVENMLQATGLSHKAADHLTRASTSEKSMRKDAVDEADSEVMVHYSNPYVSKVSGSTKLEKEKETMANCLKQCNVDLILDRPLHSLDIANILLMNVINTDNRNSIFCKPMIVEGSDSKASLGDPDRWRDECEQSVPFAANSILLVDDDKTILKFTKKMLEKSGYEVVTERNGFDGLNNLMRNVYKIAIIDRNMPVMDGLECVRRFRKWEEMAVQDGSRTSQQRIMMFSANADKINIEESIQAGADAFLGKPVKIPEMILHIEGQVKVERNRRPSLGIFLDNRDKTNPGTTTLSLKDNTCGSLKKIKRTKQSFVLPMKEGLSKYRSVSGISASPTPSSSQDGRRFTARRTERGKSDVECDACAFSDEEQNQQSCTQETKSQSLHSCSASILKMSSGLYCQSEQKQICVLVVDDDATIRKFTHSMLTKKGYKVDVCENGQTGLAALKCKLYNVAVIDMNMPVMDGLECVRRFRNWESCERSSGRRAQKQTIFMCTGGNAETELVEQKLVDLFLPKPIKIKVLIEEIELACTTIQ